ncbi:MAG: glycosyltransferase family 4 protein, partial [Chloroflexi bacterium]|nr:glycosyltransferase family 4 protein [Chloroflexota bacterium]
IVFAWGMWNLHHSILSLAESLEWIRVVYYLADTWPSLPDAYTLHWQEPARRWYTQLPKRLLGTIALKMLAWDSSLEPLEFEHAICVSTAVREILVKEGLPLKNARIIHNGIDLDHFLCTDELRNLHPENGLSLLYAGRLAPEKGVDTAIEALARLSQKRSLPSITLAIIGAGHPDYEAHLLKLVARKGLQNRVAFCRRVPREEMPELLRQFDVLVFTSICQEALARIVQEAMASGLVVVGTETGGSREILVGDKNALTFVPGDANGLAAQIERLVANPSRYRRLAEAGRRTVVEKFNINRMVNEIEEYLQRVLTTSVRR